MTTQSTNSSLKQVRAAFGSPSYESHGVLLYEVESVTAMGMLSSDLFDITITSPPYNIGKEYENQLPLDDYIEWTKEWIRNVYRLCRPYGSFWLNLGYIQVPYVGKAIPIPYLVWEEVPFYLIQEVVWNYGAGVSTKKMFSPRNEKFLWYVKSSERYTFNLDAVRDPNVKYPNQRKNGKLRVNPLGKNPTDVWQIPKVTTGEGVDGRRASSERTSHPAQFPVGVIDRIVKACSNPGDVVFDPFVGSGTTAEVAIANDRLVVGFEINKNYVNIAANRIEQFLERRRTESAQRSLF